MDFLKSIFAAFNLVVRGRAAIKPTAGAAVAAHPDARMPSAGGPNADEPVSNPRTGLITYDGLPISSGGAHTLRTREIEAGVAAVAGFLSACTTDPDPGTLFVQVREGGPIPKSYSKPLKAAFARLGLPIKSRFGVGLVTRRWPLPKGDFAEACAIIRDHGPVPRSDYGLPAAEVEASWRLVLKDPESGEVLPYQDPRHYLQDERGGFRRVGESSLLAHFSDKTHVNVFLSLPFEQADEWARTYVAALQRHFPTKFSSRHWRLWTLNKAGSRYYGRKLKGFPPH